jgi:hypothetical protein
LIAFSQNKYVNGKHLKKSEGVAQKVPFIIQTVNLRMNSFLKSVLKITNLLGAAKPESCIRNF